jgi:hypothetical protein
MKKQIARKISLSKDTLRNLSERDMTGVVGGSTFTGLCCSGGASSCCTDDTCATNACTSPCTTAGC